MDNSIFDITNKKEIVYQSIIESFSKHLPFESAVFVWFDPFLKILVAQHAYNIAKGDLIYLKEKLIDIKDPVDFILHSKIQYFVHASKLPLLDIFENKKYITFIPLVSKNEAIGLILFYNSEKTDLPANLIEIDQLIEQVTIIIKNHIYLALKDEISVLTTTIFDISQNASFEMQTGDVVWSILNFLKITFNVKQIRLFLYRNKDFELLKEDGFEKSELPEEIKNFFLSIESYYYKEKEQKLYVTLFDVKNYFGVLEMEGVINSPTLFNTFIGIHGAIVSAIKNCRLYDFAYRSAMYDFVSSVYTRHYFDVRFEEEIKRADRYSLFLSIMYIDIDEFNRIREMYSEDVCNSILLKFGKLLKENLRGTDVIARYRWDEFVVLLPNTDLEGAYIAARRLINIINTTVFDTFKITVSIGLANFPFDNKSGHELLKLAQAAVDKAKNNGGNSIVYLGNIPLIK